MPAAHSLGRRALAVFGPFEGDLAGDDALEEQLHAGAAARAAGGIALNGLGEVDAHLVGQSGHPGDHVAELVHPLLVAALADRLGELAHLLGEPGNGRRYPARTVALTEGPLDHILQFGQVHGPVLARRARRRRFVSRTPTHSPW